MSARIVLLLFISATPLRAQQSLLNRVDSLLIAGQYEQARAALADWDRANPASASIEPAQRARAIYLTARLTTDAAQAQNHYLAVALSYPTSREAPDALLRVGQSFLATGDAPRAVSYLDRLINDYPTASARPLGFLWLTRAQIATGKHASACATAMAALKSGTTITDELASLIATEQRTACTNPPPDSQRPPAVRPTPTPTTQPSSTERAPPVPVTRTGDTSSDGRYAIQIAAFREVRSANAIAAQLRRKGHDSRVVLVEGSSLSRVRIGRFRTRADALNAVRRLKAENVDGIVVDDVSRERTSR